MTTNPRVFVVAPCDWLAATVLASMRDSPVPAVDELTSPHNRAGSAGPATAVAVDLEEPRADDTPPTILLLEDRAELLEMMESVLRREGYRVLAATNSRDALVLSANPDEPLDLLIADVVVPGMHGDCLAAELKSRRPDLKVLLTSGLVSREDVADVIAGSDDDFMRKPFSGGDLVLKTNQMMQ